MATSVSGGTVLGTGKRRHNIASVPPRNIFGLGSCATHWQRT